MQAVPVHIINNGCRRSRELLTSLPEGAIARAFVMDRAQEALASPASAIIFDVDLSDSDIIAQLRSISASRKPGGTPWVFVVNKERRTHQIQAVALGADEILARPVDAAAIRRLLLARSSLFITPEQQEALALGESLLQRIMMLGQPGSMLTQADLSQDTDTLVNWIAEFSIDHWLEAIRAHHSLTLKHSLTVTGLAVAFGQRLKFRVADIKRLAVGGLLHDIGKAHVPVEILEKPGKLDPNELVVMRRHPVHGRDILIKSGGFDAEMIDVVVHHHEYLDGSGYPDGLLADSIPDIVRITTIADIFAALTEERSYKRTMSRTEAFDILVSMNGRLDPDLVEAFRVVGLQ